MWRRFPLTSAHSSHSLILLATLDNEHDADCTEQVQNNGACNGRCPPEGDRCRNLGRVAIRANLVYTDSHQASQ